jgi:hypothetical protein
MFARAYMVTRPETQSSVTNSAAERVLVLYQGTTFSRAAQTKRELGFSPCYSASRTKSPGTLGLNRLNEKASLYEGHGFSRAVTGLALDGFSH